MKMFVGLGNPGRKYANSRHNIGFTSIDEISKSLGIPIKEKRRLATIGLGNIENEGILLAKPLTFMNSSGEAVTYLINRFHICLKDILILYDDMDLPAGKIRIRPSGSAAGHNGMKSIIQAVGTIDIPRLRIGIGHPPPNKDEIDFVLANFDKSESVLIKSALEQTKQASIDLAIHGIEWTMNNHNS